MDDWLTIRTRLEGARQLQAQLAASAAEVRKFGQQVGATGRQVDDANKRNFLYQQGLFTLRRAAYGLTLGLGSLGVAALTMGVRFDSSMEQNRISLSYFLGSTKAANRELAILYKLAATTPFEFTQVTDAARRFLGFGFTIQQTNSYLRILADTAAGLGLGGEGVDRLGIVLGQIKASGRLLGQDLLQLTQAGVPALPILQSQLHLSQQQMQKLLAGQLQIPSDVAVPALMAGLKQRFGGMSALQAQTGQGLASTGLDYLRQFLGTLTGSAFERGKSNLRSINSLLQAMTKAIAPPNLGGKGGSFVDALTILDSRVGAGGRIVQFWKTLSGEAGDVFNVLRAGVPVLKSLAIVFLLTLVAAKPLLDTLGYLASHTRLLTILFYALAIRLLFTKTILGIFRLAGLIAGVDMVKFTGITKDATAAQQLFALNVYKTEIATLSASRAIGGMTGALRALKGIGVVSVGLLIADQFLPKPPPITSVGGSEKFDPSRHGPLSHIPVVGKVAGWGAYLGNAIADAVGLPPLDKPRKKTVHRSAAAGDETALEAAVRKGLESAIAGARVDMDGRKVGELVFRHKGIQGARG